MINGAHNLQCVFFCIFSDSKQQKMELCLGGQLSARTRLHIYTCVLLCLLATVSADRTLDTIYQNDIKNLHDFQSLWDVYILPHLELDLKRKYVNTLGKDNNNYSDIPGKGFLYYLTFVHVHDIMSENRSCVNDQPRRSIHKSFDL